jgi:hypothetical protein
MDLIDSQEGPRKMEMKKTDDEEEFADWIDQLHGFLQQINVVNICPLPTFDSLPLPFPHNSTLAQATDLSEEDTSTLGTVRATLLT